MRTDPPPAFDVPTVVICLILFTSAVSALALLAPTRGSLFLYQNLAFIPARFTMDGGLGVSIPATLLSPLGYSLLHGGWLHLLINMGMLLAFGAPVAQATGRLFFMLIYLTGALAGAAVVTALTPSGLVPVIGASAAISALPGALAALAWHTASVYRQRILTFVLVWLGLNLLTGLLPGFLLGVTDGRVAWEAHLGGFAAGALLSWFRLIWLRVRWR